MANTVNHSAPEQGKFRSALAIIWAFMQAMESSSFDHAFDRIDRLELEVARLNEKLRQSQPDATT